MPAHAFLLELYQDHPPGYIELFLLPNKAVMHTTDLQLAAASAEEMAEKNDVYFRPGLLREIPQGKQPDKWNHKQNRGTADATFAIPGLWLDIDLAHPGLKEKKKFNCPETSDLALNLLRMAGPEPSLVINSGHGLHSYWLFKEPWIFDTDEEHRAAALLLRRWNVTVRSVFASKGYGIDSCYDMARILRLPGTKNHKTKPSLPVEQILATSHRYTPDDFENYLVLMNEHEETEVPPVAFVVTTQMVDPPLKKLEILLTNNEQFSAVWNGTRKLPRDNSPSAYDLSLANAAAAAGWTDQEITDLIIYWRRKNNHPIKQHLRYYQLTIQRARQNVPAQSAMLRLSETAATMNPDAKLPDDAREPILKEIGKLLGITLQRWIQYGRENAIYVAEIDHCSETRSIRIGTVDAVLDQKKFRAKIYEATSRAFTIVKQHEWTIIAQLLGKVAELKIIAEAERANRATDWLASYFESFSPGNPDEYDQALLAKRPCLEPPNHLSLSADALLHHINYAMNERPSRGELLETLLLLGFHPVSSMGRDPGEKSIHRRRWRISISNATSFFDSSNSQFENHPEGF